MKFLLYLICYIGLTASLYYFGFFWWTFPLFMSCMVLAKSRFGIDKGKKDDLVYGIKSFSIVYFIGVTIYIFAGDGYMDRAINSLDSFKVFLNVIAAIPLGTIFARSSSTGHSSITGHFNHSQNESNDDDCIDYPRMDFGEAKHAADKAEMDRQHQESEDMGYHK